MSAVKFSSSIPAKQKGTEESDDVWKAAASSHIYSQSFCESHGHHLMVRCPDILPSRNEHIRSSQRREHQTLQHEAFNKSTSPVFGCLVRGVFLTKHFKPIVRGWIACQRHPEPLQMSVGLAVNKPTTQQFQQQQLQTNSPFQILGSGGFFNSCQIENIDVFVKKAP